MLIYYKTRRKVPHLLITLGCSSMFAQFEQCIPFFFLLTSSLNLLFIVQVPDVQNTAR
jgi:hypothetical protein